MNPEKRVVLPPIAFRSFAQSYIAPELSEGFEDITRINFEVNVLLRRLARKCQLMCLHSSKAQMRNEKSGQSTG